MEYIYDKNYFDNIYSSLVCKDNNGVCNTFEKIFFKPFDNLNLKFKNKFVFFNYAGTMFLDKINIDKSFFDFLIYIASLSPALVVTNSQKIEDLSNCNFDFNFSFIKEKIDQIHSFGTKIFLSIKSRYGRISKVCHSGFLTSSCFCFEYKNINKMCFPVTDKKCSNIIKLSSKISNIVNDLNFDGIVIDASLSNLIGEMSSKEFNHKIFGHYTNSVDLISKILRAIKQNNKDFPVLVKFTPYSFLYDCYGSHKIKSLSTMKFDNIEPKCFEIIENLVNIGADGFIFEFGAVENEFLSEFSPFIGHNLYQEFYINLTKYIEEKNIKNSFNYSPLIVCKDNLSGKYENKISYNLMFDITRDIYADEKFISNMLLSLPNKNCLRCGICKQYAINNDEIYCLINPEIKYSLNKQIENKNKKIAVVGAGIAGVVTAITLAKRGYKCDLFEKKSKLNLNGKICSVFDFDKYLSNYNKYLEEQIKQYVSTELINLKLGTEFEINLAKNYDSIVVATGFKEKVLDINGAVLKSVVSIFDLLENKNIIIQKKHIVLLAKSELSFKLALYLSINDVDVAVIVEDPTFLINMPQNLISYYLLAFSKQKIKMIIDCKIKSISDDLVELFVNFKTQNIDYVSLIMNLRSGKKYKYMRQAKVIDCNLFVFEPDIVSNNKLFYDIILSGFAGNCFMVGDALKIDSLCENIKSAYFVGNNL